MSKMGNSTFACGVALITALLLCPAAPAQSLRQRELLDDGWRFHLNELDGNSAVTAGGLPITNWVWIADDNATNDAGTMAAPGLDTSSWTNVIVGTDVFSNRVGYAWFRSVIPPLTSAVRPVTLYFLNMDDNGTVYLNGVLLGQHDGYGQPFDITLDPAWISGATNYLTVAVQNTGGPGAMLVVKRSEGRRVGKGRR